MFLARGALLECLLDILDQRWPPEFGLEELFQVARLSMYELAMVSENDFEALGEGYVGYEIYVVY